MRRAFRSRSLPASIASTSASASRAPERPATSSPRVTSTEAIASASRSAARRTSSAMTLPEPSQMALTGASR